MNKIQGTVGDQFRLVLVAHGHDCFCNGRWERQAHDLYMKTVEKLNSGKVEFLLHQVHEIGSC